MEFEERYEALIIGAGIGGIYAAHRIRQMGLTFKVLEAAGGVGGTWYWNRYPGARCDSDSLDYSFSFSPELEQEWTWSERYASQPEILAYLNHVVDRFGLREHFSFDCRVSTAVYDDRSRRWVVQSAGRAYSARYVLMCTGLLSSPIVPNIAGLDAFVGRTYFASRWPHDNVSFQGQRVGVIGTGSSAIQLIPVVAREAKQLTVFQRTPNYSVPAKNGPVDSEYLRDYRARYREIRAAERNSWLGSYWSTFEVNDRSGLSASAEERQREYEWRWERGGQGFMVAYTDLMTDLDVNRTCADFVRSKISAIVTDPRKRAALLPPESDAIACKRLCVDTDYFSTFNQQHVDIVDLRSDPIVTVEAQGVRTASGLREFDALIYATGFDAYTGALEKLSIRGRGGQELKRKWRDGPRNFLGVVTSDFPNLFFINGPLTAPGNYMTTTEMLVERVTELMAHTESIRATAVDVTPEAEEEWCREVQRTAESMPALLACKSWLFGANVPGKPRTFLAYFGGLKPYHERWGRIAHEGYREFRFTA